MKFIFQIGMGTLLPALKYLVCHPRVLPITVTDCEADCL